MYRLQHTRILIFITLLALTLSATAQEVSPAIAVKATTAPTIDGNLADWKKAHPQHLTKEAQVVSNRLWKGADDFSAVTYLMWDNAYLYVAAEVTDDMPFRYLETPKMDGIDALAIFLNTDTNADAKRVIFSSTDFYVLFGLDNKRFPTALNRDAVLLKKGLKTSGMDKSGKTLNGAEVAVTPTKKGYIVEAKLPFGILANDRLPLLQPVTGMQLSFNLQFIDLDEATEDEVDSLGNRVSLISLFPGNPEKRPKDWGFIVFK